MTTYSQQRLRDAAARAGHSVSPEQIERWVGLGLLDQATPIGRSRGKGVDRRWPQAQHDLLLSVLVHHQRTRSMRALLNIPVFVWAVWGEDYVPLRQVRRALESWVRMVDKRRGFQARRAASALVRGIAKPRAPSRARQILVDELADAFELGELDESEVRRLLFDVVGPPDASAQTDGTRAYSLIEAQLMIAQRFAVLTDGHFQWARAFFLFAMSEYATSRASLAADPRFGKLHEPFDLQHLMNRACHDLALVLSIALAGGPQDLTTPEQLRLETWLAGRAHIRTRVDLKLSQLLVPAGMSVARLGIRVEIVVDPADSAGSAPGVD